MTNKLSKPLSLDLLMLAVKPIVQKVELDQGHVHVKQWTLAESDHINSIIMRRKEDNSQELNSQIDVDWRKALIQHSLCDEVGNPLFSDETIDQHSQLPVHVINKLVEAAMICNGMKTADMLDGQESPN